MILLTIFLIYFLCKTKREKIQHELTEILVFSSIIETKKGLDFSKLLIADGYTV